MLNFKTQMSVVEVESFLILIAVMLVHLEFRAKGYA